MTGPGWGVHLPPGRLCDDLDLLRDGSLPGRWTRLWSERPAWPQLRDVDDRWLSSDEQESRSREVARRLRVAGLRAGDRFALSGQTSAELVIAFVGALRAGLTVVPLNTAYTRAEVERIVRDAAPAGAAVDDSELAGWIAAASARDIPVVGLDVALPHGRAGSDEELDRAQADDPALLIYTSGTTGKPKGARLTHGNLLASATAVQLAWRWSTEDRLLLTLPLFHVHGLGVGLIGALCAGSAVELRPRFDRDDVLTRAHDGATMLFGVPTMYQRLAASDRVDRLQAFRLLVSGSAPLPPSVAEAIGEATGQIPLERYGMTETIMLTSNPYDGPRRPGTVGLPFPGVEVRIGDDDEIQVRGPNVISEYYEQPDATAEAFTDDGWFRTGDLGELDEAGYLTIIGRSKELIITGGFNVYPREIEEQLLTHPDVKEVAVVGRPSEAWGEEVTAVVVAERPVSAEALREHAADGLVAYKVPKRFEFADELPRNALGKVLRGELSGP
jgi:malonyl-CoA/methylmalonyl-CoA synthetase